MFVKILFMKFKYWIPTIILLIFIWGNSLLNGHISTMISAFVKALLFRESYDFVIETRSDALLRKIAHFSEYFLLCITCLYSLYKSNFKNYKTVFAFLIVAVIDETIQLFIADRSGSYKDVILDWCGFLSSYIVSIRLLKTIKKAWFKPAD